MCDRKCDGSCAPPPEPFIRYWTREHFETPSAVADFLHGMPLWQATAAKVLYDMRSAEPYLVIHPVT